MKTILYECYGEPADVLTLRTVPDHPAPGRDEVLIRVRACPIHPGDLIGVRGGYRAPSSNSRVPTGGSRPGFEGTGVIEALGAGIAPGTGLVPGARVAFFPVSGAWGEYVLSPARFVTPVPGDMPDGIAAQLHVNPLTASLLQRAVAAAGASSSDLLVFSAAGSSVGRILIHRALAQGHAVIGLVRSRTGADKLQAIFPEATILSTDAEDWPDQLRSATDSRPVRAVLDPVGGPLAGRLIKMLAEGGAFIGYGDLSRQPIPVPSLVFPVRALTMSGVSVGRWSGLPADIRQSDVAEALQIAETAPELFNVAKEYDFAEITQAVMDAEKPGRSGAVLLTSR